MEGKKISTCIWAHSDPRGLNAVAENVSLRLRLNYQSTSIRDTLADQRAWFVAVLASAANVGSKPVTYDQSTQTATVQIVPFDTMDKNEEWQLGITNALIALIIRREISLAELTIWSNQGYRDRIATEKGSDATKSETSGPIVIGAAGAAIIAVGMVAAAGVLAGALVWINGQEIEKQVVIEQIDAKVEEHAKLIETSRDIIESHQEREQLEGRTIPWSQEELAYLDYLEQSAKEITGWTAPPLRSVPDAKKMSEAASKAIENTGEAVKNVSEGAKGAIETSGTILPIAAALVALYYLSEN